MKVVLKDGSSLEVEKGISVLDLAKKISEGLARVATAGKVNGEVKDLRYKIEEDNAQVEILTFENGVGITNSCGSASLCTFQYLLDLNKVENKIEFLSLGGRYSVEKMCDKLCLFGRVNYVYKGELIDEY